MSRNGVAKCAVVSEATRERETFKFVPIPDCTGGIDLEVEANFHVLADTILI